MRAVVACLAGMCAVGFGLGCSGIGDNEDDFTSNQATLLTFEFDGELVTKDAWNLEHTANDQLLYTIGHLNGSRAVGRLDATKLTNFKTDRLDDGTTHVTFHAVMPVGWGSKTNLPKTYDLTLPKRVDYQGLQDFATKYEHSGCVEAGAHDVSVDSLWYYFRPSQSGCSLAETDVVHVKATVTKSAENTEGKYPEYDKVWSDDTLSVVAIFGKYDEGATSSSDSGISAFNRFVQTARATWKNGTVTPADLPNAPGTEHPDVTIEAPLPGGRTIRITALLTDKISSAPQAFYDRYEGLSTSADLIFYNGHSGLGQNVRALAQKGKFEAGKYQIFFMNGCDSFAYVDGSLAKTRSVLNPDDPTGTKYMDVITNVMPSFFTSMPDASLAVIAGLAAPDAPKTYQQIFENIDKSEVVVVTGEEDNAYTPAGPTEKWSYADKGTVTKGQSKELSLGELPAGSYSIAMHEDQSKLGGDADLYVRFGAKPTLTSSDYRPWIDGSNEEVTFKLEVPTTVFVMVNGYDDGMTDPSASFTLAGKTVE